MFTVTFSTNSPAMVDRIRKKSPIAQVRALNRAIGSANTAMVRAIAQDLGVKQAIVRERIKIQPATADRFRARLYANAKRIPLIDLGAKGPEPSRGRGTGVTVRGAGGNRRRIPNAFIATMRSGHRGVFERADGKGRRGPRPNRSQLPIRELFGPSIWKVFQKFEYIGIARGREQLIKNLQSEFRFVLSVDSSAA